jgi:hypothetical protein
MMQSQEAKMGLFEGAKRRRHRAVAAGVGVAALGIIAVVATAARAADLDYGPPDRGAYQDRPYYPPRAQVYPGPDEVPYGYGPYGYRPYGYRPYGPAYRPRAWVDPDDYYGDDAYRERYHYYQRPYAELPRPPAVVPRGPYVGPRDVPPDSDDMVAEDAPPRYGWREGWRAPPRW